jgi:hypothetical protein
MFIAFFASNIGFIHLDFAHELRKVYILHCRSYPVAHIPCRPVISAPDLPVDLESTDTLLALGHKVNDLKPNTERVISVLKDRLGNDREAIAVFPATILVLTHPMEGPRLESINFLAIATGAMNPAGPAEGLQKPLAILFGLKTGLELGKCHGGFCCFHGS